MKHTKSNQSTRGRADPPEAAEPVNTGLEPLMKVELIIHAIHQRADHLGPLLNDILQVGHIKHVETVA